jgi:hypothetical protein
MLEEEQTESTEAAPRLEIGLMPALHVDESFTFGPLRIEPMRLVQGSALVEIARRFDSKRGSDWERQVYLSCDAAHKELVAIVLPIFEFACVAYARFGDGQVRECAHPECFFLAPIWSSRGGFAYQSGHSTGWGEAVHMPLRWPVDATSFLRPRSWDYRFHVGSEAIAQDVARAATCPRLASIAMAADIALAATERRQQYIENVAPSYKAVILLATAFEALHAAGTNANHRHDEVAELARFRVDGSRLAERVFSQRSLDGRPPLPKQGDRVTRQQFVVSILFYLRNQCAHGKVPSAEAWYLPAELGGGSVFRVATSILAMLMAQDLMEWVKNTHDGEGVNADDQFVVTPEWLKRVAFAEGARLHFLKKLEDQLCGGARRERRES